MRANRLKWIFRSPHEVRQVLLLAAGVVFLVCLAGCRQKIPLVPVEGEVLLDGQPVAEGAVAFTPVGGGPVATGLTDAQGRFQLQTANQPGAPPGEYVVTVAKYTILGLNPDGTSAAGGIRYQWHVPERYSKPSSSGLKAKVDRAQRRFRFELSSR